MEWVTLNNLPVDHPYRNTPLIELDAEYVSRDSKLYYKVQPAFTIAKNKVTFNQLADLWTTYDTWRVPIKDEWNEERMDIIGQNGNEGSHY